MKIEQSKAGAIRRKRGKSHEAIWVVVADASIARIYNLESDRELILVRTLEHPRGRARAQELASDEPGRINKSGGRFIQSAMDPHTEPHEVESVRFAAEITNILQKGLDARSYAELVVIAPPHFLGLLRHAMEPHIIKYVRRSVARNLTRTAPPRLTGALQVEIDQLQPK